uniref:MFS domain-containing protein n=1 Tax=Parastrongyloides trichosuri TaxID=131310 RepID=A0A0N5A765_PARTI
MDGFCTPTIGFLSDGGYIPKAFNKFGRRISWHLIGTIAVAISFPFIFSGCWFCTSPSGWIANGYLLICICLFQFGWAAVQISHLALIPEMTTSQSVRTSMQSFRYAFSMIANVMVFSLLYYLFQTDDKSGIIDESDLKNFSRSSIILTVIGLFTSALFYILTKPHWCVNNMIVTPTTQTTIHIKMSWLCWLKNYQYYLVSILYMLCRLNVNVSQVYFPFYVIITLRMSKSYVAILPLIIYISSFFCSLFIGIPWISRTIGRKATFMFGVFIALLNCVLFFCDQKNLTFILVIFMGIAQSVLLVSSVSLTADLINKNIESGAFVYGSMSLFDKISNGITFQLIEIFNPNCNSRYANVNCSDFYRDILVIIPGVCAFLMFIILLILLPQKIGKRNNDEDNNLLLQHDTNDIIE